MPTEPLESILYRELSLVDGKELIDIASPLLQELVNFGTNALVRCLSSASGGIDEDLAPFALFRHIIEMTDGIEVLLSQSCSVPAIPALRSSFEALLSLEYILEDQSVYAQRSLAWLVGYVHQRIDMYQCLDPATNKGAEFKRLFDSDEVASRISLPAASHAQRAESNLRAFLARSHIQPIEAEYLSYRRRPNWYHLFGGPRHLRELAKYLSRGAQYEILYRHWSRTAHSQDLLQFIGQRDEQNQAAIGRLRQPQQINQTASFAASFMLGAIRLTVSTFRPGEDLSRWYTREVRDRYLTMTGET